MSLSFRCRSLAALLLVAGNARVSQAQLGARKPCDADAVRTMVCAVDDSLAAALVRADTAVLSKLYADDLVTTNYRGGRSGKPILLRAIATGRLRFEVLQPSGRSVEISGDTARLAERVHQVATGPEGQHPTEVDYRRTYVRRAERWQLVATVITVAPPP